LANFKNGKNDYKMGQPMNCKIFEILLIITILSSSSLVLAVHGPDCVFAGSNSSGATLEIGGHITSSSTWTSGNKYLLTSDTTIDPSVTVTMQSGVQVQFADQTSLTVEGSLVATGTTDNPIVFTSANVLPVPGAWGTINCAGSASDIFSLKHVKVEFATQGFTAGGTGYVEIKQSELVNCSESGILIERSNLALTENTIHYNKNGITSQSGATLKGLSITGNTVSHNSENGIYLFSYGYYGVSISDITVTSNTLSSNGQDGICIYSHLNGEFTANSDVSNITISSNIISSNGQNGISLHSHGISYGHAYCNIINDTISANTISSNGENGIHMLCDGPRGGGGSSFLITDVSIYRNTVSSNVQNGIYSSAESSNNNLIFNNNFVNNTAQLAYPTVGYSWDNGSEGNYWSDYSGLDANHDGIGDTPYAICQSNTDNYPLMNYNEQATPSLAPSPSQPQDTQNQSPSSSPSSQTEKQPGFLGTNLPAEYCYTIVAVFAVAAVLVTAFMVKRKHQSPLPPPPPPPAYRSRSYQKELFSSLF
jgi:hypothetical protein